MLIGIDTAFDYEDIFKGPRAPEEYSFSGRCEKWLYAFFENLYR